MVHVEDEEEEEEEEVEVAEVRNIGLAIAKGDMLKVPFDTTIIDGKFVFGICCLCVISLILLFLCRNTYKGVCDSVLRAPTHNPKWRCKGLALPQSDGLHFVQ